MLEHSQADVSFEVIIPVISTAIIAVIGYVMQIITLYLTGKKEDKSKKIESYADFYIDLLFELNAIILAYQDYCIRRGKVSWNEFGKKIITMIVTNSAREEDKRMIDKINSSMLKICTLYKNKSYYPMSRKVHKNCMKLCLFCDCIKKLGESRFSEDNINKCSEYILLPDIERLLDYLIAKA